ncbi:DEAD/DEAH box helicase [Niallia sp. NCCP-28]|uniref:DEAD/DEAH box helicase n=1 Tax=Niallia sp. NCCP-28 TaxID=2934712 RepID=UPI00207EF7DA|nr:DEAD/DEAH box helicase [Niallia sp. NCCP-28]GKU83069.1 DEAD-box ATP-dependent RNA helicase CshE [Niallia sp. NCCP-28]
MQDFKSLGISSNLEGKLNKYGITSPTPIQTKVIPSLLKGQDIIAQAQTGTGKTFAFALPILEKIKKDALYTQALILSPTRELALQITDEINKIKEEDITVLAAYGGQDVEKQLHRLKQHISIIVATPGRLIDHLKRGTIDLSSLSFLVLDEADQMLHIGFLEEIAFIMRQTPNNRQTMLFSATISSDIKKLAKKYTKNAAYVTVEKKQGPALTVKQISMHTPPRAKQGALMSLIKEEQPFMAVIFCRTKRRVSKLYEVLRANRFSCRELHGDLSQAKREQVMKEFREAKFQLLIATDVAARGLDIDGITHVFNYDMPMDADSYVHRIGRTGRAKAEGYAVTFYSSDDRPLLDAIEKELNITIEKKPLPKKDGNGTEQSTEPIHQASTHSKNANATKGTFKGKRKSKPAKKDAVSRKQENKQKETNPAFERFKEARKKKTAGSAIFKPKKSKKR